MLAISVTILIALCIPVMKSYSISDSGDGNVHRLNVVQDVVLERLSGNANSDPTLIIGLLDQFPKKRSLIQFENLRGANCPLKKIRWAKMYLYYLYAHKASWHSIRRSPYLSRPIQVHMVKKRWLESQATSGRRLNGVSWSRPWLDLSNNDAEATPQGCSTTIYANRPSGFVEFDITRAVRSWRKGSPNYGLVLWATDEHLNGRGLRFASTANRDQKKHGFVHVMCDY